MCLGTPHQSAATAPSDDGAARAEWEVKIASLSDGQCDLPPVELVAPGLRGRRRSLHVGGRAAVDASGAVSFTVELPPGARALLGLWVGPGAPKLRILTASWAAEEAPEAGEDTRHKGLRGAWSLSDHAAGETLRFGLALFLVALPADAEPCAGRFVLGEVLGEGCNGEVRAAEDHSCGRVDLVAKVPVRGAGLDLLVEAWALEKLRGQGLPECCGLFREGSRDVLVMKRLHRDLQSIKQDPSICPEGRFSPQAVALLGTEVLSQLQAMHGAGLAHGDLKPKNMMLADGSASAVHVVDFGVCRPFRSGSMFAMPRATAPAVGTTRFCSVPAHSGERSPRSDVESLAYVLIYMATGSLPWQGRGTAGSKRERAAQLLEGKLEEELLQQHTREGLAACPALAEVLLSMVKACRTIDREAMPDYPAMQEALRGVGSAAVELDRPKGCAAPGAMQELDRAGAFVIA